MGRPGTGLRSRGLVGRSFPGLENRGSAALADELTAAAVQRQLGAGKERKDGRIVDVLQLIDRLEQLVSSGTRLPLSSRTMIDEQEFLDIIDR